MRKILKSTLVAFILGYLHIASIPVYAASQDECAIWLCLPAGFPGGCESAHSAMRHRLKHHKSPLPSFASCAVNDKGEKDDSGEWDYSFRNVIKIEEHQECVEWGTKVVSRDNEQRYCKRYETIKAHVRPGNSCYVRKGGNDTDPVKIEGCVGTAREIKIFQNGKIIGAPYYF